MRFRRRATNKHRFVVSTVFGCFFSVYVFSKLIKRFDRKCANNLVSAQNVMSQRSLEILRNYNLRSKDKKISTNQKENINLEEKLTVLQLQSNRTDYFDCADFEKIPDTYQIVKENIAGNRGISFLKIYIEGRLIDVVFKEGTK